MLRVSPSEMNQNRPEVPDGASTESRRPTAGERMFKAAMRRRDTDTVARGFRMKAFGWASFPALFIGGTVMVKIGLVPGLLAVGGIFFGVGGGALMFGEVVSRSVRGATNPYGSRRPTDHSRADTFLAKGDASTAIAVLEASLLEFPDDSGAMLRIARIRRDSLSDPEGAFEAFRVARASGALSTSEMRVSIREMLALTGRIGEPARIAPELARQRDAFPGTDESEWAAAELLEAKRSIDR